MFERLLCLWRMRSRNDGISDPCMIYLGFDRGMELLIFRGMTELPGGIIFRLFVMYIRYAER